MKRWLVLWSLLLFCGHLAADDAFLMRYRPYRNDTWVDTMLNRPKPVSEGAALYTSAMERRAAARGDALQGQGLLLAVQLRYKYPHLSDAQLTSFIRDVRKAYENQLRDAKGVPLDEQIRRIQVIGQAAITTAGLLSGAGIASGDPMTLYQGVREADAILGEDAQRKKDSLVLQTFQHVTGSPLQSLFDPSYGARHLPGIDPQIYEEARKDPRLQTLVEAANEPFSLNPDGSHIRVNSPPEEILRKMPELRDSLAVREVLRLQREGKLTKEAMLRLLEKIRDEQKQLAKDVATIADELGRQRREQLEAQERALLEERQRQEWQRQDDRVALARAGFGFYTSILRGLDPQGARVVHLVGTTTFDLMDNIRKFKADRITSDVFTANLFNIASNLLSAIFGGPSDLEIIMKELGEIRKEIRAMHEDMMKMFGELQVQLAGMADHFDRRFNQLERELNSGLANLRESLDAIENGIGRLHDRIEILEGSTRSSLREGFFLRTQEAINDASTADLIRTLTPAKVREYLNLFATCGSNLSTLPLFSGGQVRLATGSGAVAASQRGEVELFASLQARLGDADAAVQEVQTLAELFEGQFGIRSIPRSGERLIRLPHRGVWETCTKAYLMLALHQPTLFRQLDAGKLRQLYFIGRALHAFQRNLATGRDRETLASHLVTAYERIGDSLDAAVAQARIEYINDINKISEQRNPGGYDPTLGYAQSLQYREPLSRMVGNVSVCSDAPAATRSGWYEFHFPADEALYRKLIPKPFVMAAQMGLGTLQLCFTEIETMATHPTEVRALWEFNLEHTPILGRKRHWMTYRHGRLRLKVALYFTPRAGADAGKPKLVLRSHADTASDYPYEFVSPTEPGSGSIPVYREHHDVTLDAKSHLRNEQPTLVSRLATPGEVSDNGDAVVQLIERELRNRAQSFNLQTLQNTLRGKLDGNLKALTGAKAALLRWAELSALPARARVTQAIGELPDAESLKDAAFEALTSRSAERQASLFASLRPKAEAVRTVAGEALREVTRATWRAPHQDTIEWIEQLAAAHAIPLR